MVTQLSKSIAINVGRLVLIATAPAYFISTYRNLFLEPAYFAAFAFTIFWLAVLLLTLRRLEITEKTRLLGLGTIIFLVSIMVIFRNHNLQAGLLWATFSTTMFSLVIERKWHLFLSLSTSLALTLFAIQIDVVQWVEGAKTGFAGWAIMYGVITVPAMLFAALEEKTSELATANRVKADFIANMSHEIRTPLNAMFGSMQVIKAHPEDAESVARYTSVAMDSYHSVIGIVNDILDLSKLAERKVTLYPEPTNVSCISCYSI